MSPEPVRNLYDILEVSFEPLSLCTRAAPILDDLAKDEAYVPYLSLLRHVLVYKLLSQLSEVYSSIKISNLKTLVAPLNGSSDSTVSTTSASCAVWADQKLETILMSAVHSGQLFIRVDHAQGIITFSESLFTPSTPISVQPSPTSVFISRVNTVATTLYTTLQALYPVPQLSQEEKLQNLVNAAQAERKAIHIRQLIITRRRELLSELSVRKEKEEASRKAEQLRREKEEESRRAIEDVRRRQIEQARKTLEQSKTEEARKLAQTLKTKMNVAIDVCTYSLVIMDCYLLFIFRISTQLILMRCFECKLRTLKRNSVNGLSVHELSRSESITLNVPYGKKRHRCLPKIMNVNEKKTGKHTNCKIKLPLWLPRRKLAKIL